MTTWSNGYRTDVTYTYGVYREMTPMLLDYAALCRGYLPLREEEGFTFCELGCGHGMTTSVLAAANPHGEFYANDFNPHHVSTARYVVQEAGLQNVDFYDDSFQDFAKADLPTFDYIVLHGVYSWVAERERKAIQAFIEKKLKPGGVVYISYNTLPGWAPLMPMRHLMVQFAQRSNASTWPQKVEDAYREIKALANNDIRFFETNPAARQWISDIEGSDLHYLPHEYLNADWQPMHFSQVARELAEAKLSYLGPATQLDQLDFLNLHNSAIDELAAIQDVPFREDLRDFYVNRRFRKDIFARGLFPLPDGEQMERLYRVPFALAVARNTVSLEHRFSIGVLTLLAHVYEPIIDFLAEKTATLGDLVAMMQAKDVEASQVHQAVRLLTGLGYTQPLLSEHGYATRKDSADRFNAMCMQRSRFVGQFNYLASPMTGGPVFLSRVSQLLLRAELEQKDPVSFVWGELSSQGHTLIKDNVSLQTEEENLAWLRELADDFAQNTLPALQKVGIA
ncbi:MAG: methyltransferase regulatory domain-containing protein [Myxococcales bacterium]|nr:methyltransferase regulatory domain-containing protein [Myxococcales bacterium]